MNKIGIYFAYWTKEWIADYNYYIDKVASLGFDILEISTGCMLSMNDSELIKLKNNAQSKGIELTYCIGFPNDKDMASPDEKIRNDGIEYAKRTLEMVYKMGGTIFGGINYSSWPGQLISNENKKSYLERSISSMQKVIKTSEDYGILYCVEVVNRFEQYLINTAQEGVEFVKAVDSPNIKLLLDTFHMNIEEDSIGNAIRLAGDKLGHLHIGENNRREPGKGRIPWDEIAIALKEINYNGGIVMEPFVKMGGNVGRDIKVYRNLSDCDEAGMDRDAKDALEFIKSKIRRAN